MTKKVTSLYICPWSLNDPLCQSQSLAYIRSLARRGYKFVLITFEASKYKMSGAETIEIKRELHALGIHWYPVDWHFGLAFPQKMLGAFRVLTTAVRAARRHKPEIVHSRSSVPAFFAVAVAKLFNLKFLYDADSVLSQEYVDVGHWSPTDSNYKFLSSVESAARRRADAVIVLTDKLKDDFIKNFAVKSSIHVIPCCVDVAEFSQPPEVRRRRRGELNLADEKLLVYVGKIGVRYLVEEVFAFFKIFAENFPASRLLIISRDEEKNFRQLAQSRGIPDDSYFVKSGEHREVREWLAAADAGLCLIHQVKSERGSSPIKFSEYLSSGLPVVITGDIGDCSDLVETENVGVVLEEGNRQSYDSAARKLLRLCNGNAREVSAQCRRIAERHYSLESVGIKIYKQIYEELLQK